MTNFLENVIYFLIQKCYYIYVWFEKIKNLNQEDIIHGKKENFYGW